MPNRSAEPMPVGDENCGLLRRRLIFADPERSVVRISPDGARVAFRAPIDGVLNLWVAPIDRVDEARPVTAVTDRNLGPWIVWMRDNRHVVFFREAAGDENLARLAGRSGHRRCAAADTRTRGDLLRSAKLAPFSQRIADRPQ